MPYATYRFNKIIAAETIRFIVTVAIVVYKGLKLVVYRMLTTILAYGDISSEEKELFRKLVARNAANMNFESYEVRFTTEAMLNDVVKEIVERWKKY